MDRRIVRRLGCGALLWWGCGLGLAGATGPDAGVEPPAAAVEREDRPWLQPIGDTRPIRRMSALKSEYRRIRDLRRDQLQPEYERRRSAFGDEAADAWREDTLRTVARRDLRDLRARLER